MGKVTELWMNDLTVSVAEELDDGGWIEGSSVSYAKSAHTSTIGVLADGEGVSMTL